MQSSLLISSIASNQGKTLLTTALLYYFRSSVRPFKIGPDYIDPQFHQRICQTPSINLDSFMMNDQQVIWLYQQYSDKKISILEGVMGFYDGEDKGCSAYHISKHLHIPTLLLLDARGSYITLSAVLKGLTTYKEDNTIKAVVLNRVSSSMHYTLIKSQIEKDFDDIVVLGYIKKDLTTLESTHLGLDLNAIDTTVLEKLSQEVLEHIDINALLTVAQSFPSLSLNRSYPFEVIHPTNKTIAVVFDTNFSFLYYDNIRVLQELFKEVIFIDSTQDHTIPTSCDAVFIPGGYVETNEAYDRIKHSHQFKRSLIDHASHKPIYAECAGLLYLSNGIDSKTMSGILNIDFRLNTKRNRLGYYYGPHNQKGHAFHYSEPIDDSNGYYKLTKSPDKEGKVGAWKEKNTVGTYLHIMFRNNISLIKEYFGI